MEENFVLLLFVNRKAILESFEHRQSINRKNILLIKNKLEKRAKSKYKKKRRKGNKKKEKKKQKKEKKRKRKRKQRKNARGKLPQSCAQRYDNFDYN